jgi:P21-Rho-binding domain
MHSLCQVSHGNLLVLAKLAPPQVQAPYQAPSLFNNSKNKKRDNVKKLTKADIGTPSNFKHVTHVGWDARKGFDLSGEEDEALKKVLEKAGVSENHMNDRATRNFIYDFIQTYDDKTDGRAPARTKTEAPKVPTRNQVRFVFFRCSFWFPNNFAFRTKTVKSHIELLHHLLHRPKTSQREKNEPNQHE